MSKGGVAKVEKGYLANLIAERMKEYDVMEKIPEVTIRKQFQQGNHNPKHPGTKSPLAEAEAVLVTICIQIGVIRQPLNVNEGIKCMDDLLRGTDNAEALAEFQRQGNLVVTSLNMGWSHWVGGKGSLKDTRKKL